MKENSDEDSEGEETIKTKKEEQKVEVDEDEEAFERKDLTSMINENAVLFQQIMLLSGQLAPIMDRVGRMYTDFSPHLLYNVNNFNNDLRQQESRTNAERRRNRRRQRREQNRNRSEENSRRSEIDEEFDDILSNSSDSFSRGSNDSNNGNAPSQRNGNRGSNEIRTRLNSISNTINRIRSSISSMRSLIFNNLGRGERDEPSTENEFRIDERGDTRLIVNAQVPVISSPGDIASVHNIFDRFVDRQMINIIGGDRTQNRGNRPNRNNSNNAESNESNERANTDSEPNQNNANSQPAQNIRNRRMPNQSNDPLADLVGDAGPLGFLNSALGGIGLGQSNDTIELHIHAFVPSNNREEGNAQRAQPASGLASLLQASAAGDNRGLNLAGSNQNNQNSNNAMSQRNNVNRASAFEERAVQTIERRSRRGRRSRNREREDGDSNDRSFTSSAQHSHRHNSPSSFARREVEATMVNAG